MRPMVYIPALKGFLASAEELGQPARFHMSIAEDDVGISDVPFPRDLLELAPKEIGAI
jgi:hypothetical protein